MHQQQQQQRTHTHTHTYIYKTSTLSLHPLESNLVVLKHFPAGKRENISLLVLPILAGKFLAFFPLREKHSLPFLFVFYIEFV